MKTKIIDVEYILEGLENIGYVNSMPVYNENNGVITCQIRFSNSNAVVTVYDTNKQNNSVVGGKISCEEKDRLKNIVDGLKSKVVNIDPINKIVVDLIKKGEEDDYYDYKLKYHEKKEDLLHDILCLSNNTRNCDAYLIFGVKDNKNNNKFEVVGLNKKLVSNDIFDFLKTIKFAGGHMPNVEIKNLYYLYNDIGVIVCKRSKLVPFFLEDRYDGVNSYQIYTRVGDTNTPKNRNASYIDIEKLWKFHFEK